MSARKLGRLVGLVVVVSLVFGGALAANADETPSGAKTPAVQQADQNSSEGGFSMLEWVWS
jgi:hypothetical protein